MQIIINCALYVHVLFSVRKKEALIAPEWADHLHNELREILLREQCVPIAINGTGDHIHLLFEMYPFHQPDEFLYLLKRRAQCWIEEQKLTDVPFEWQDGYALFGTDTAGSREVADYIARQEEIHARESYRDEFRRLLIEHEIEFEEEGLPHEPE